MYSRSLIRVLNVPKLSPAAGYPKRWSSQNLQENYANDFTNRMTAWQLIDYGDERNLQLSESVEVPVMSDANQVLVKVSAASVNPLDVEMMRGFGAVLLKNMRQLSSLCRDTRSELPLVLGRDFAGTVVAKGCSVTEFEIGDEVYGVVKPQDQGCHSEYAITTNSLLAKKPEFISMEESSAILYTTMTAWSALKVSGNLIINSPKNKRILVLGGSGGVGNAAIQLLKAWNAQVVTTCNTDAIPLVEKLSPEIIIDYTSPNHQTEIKAAGEYDIILDAAGIGEKSLDDYVPYLTNCGSIITLKSPLLSNIDSLGLLGGSVKSIFDFAVPNVLSGVFKKGGLIKWGFFMPLGTAVKEISELVDEHKILPHIEHTYSYSAAPEAYIRMKDGHLRGKLVISMRNENLTKSDAETVSE